MRLAHWAAKLYPRWWRERYGAEFAALLDDTRPGTAGAFDIAKGAMTMQLTTWSTGRTMLASLVLGVLLSGVTLAAWPRQFSSTSTLVAASETSPQDLAQKANTAANAVLSRAEVGGMLERHKLYPTVTNREAAIERFRERVNLAPVRAMPGDKAGMAIQFQDEDAAVAQRVTAELTQRFVRATPGMWVEADPASAAKQEMPSVMGTIGVGTVLSLGVGGLVALVLGWRRKKQAA